MNAETMKESPVFALPELDKDHKYHVFISYSSRDSIWVFGLIHELEKTIPGLKICFHERDFVPGRTIMDNMVECIQSSQKTIMVLSPDFVHSRWCLFETNLSIIQGCLMHKAIVPIMLKPCPVPLYLSTLSYLEADDEQFLEKLTQVILNKNDQVPHSSLIHYQPSILYSGKTLYNLTAVNEESETWQPGVFSSAPVPDSLRAVVDDSRIYKEVIETINDIKPHKSLIHHTATRVVICILCVLLGLGGAVFFIGTCLTFLDNRDQTLSFGVLVFLPILITAVIFMMTLLIKVAFWKKQTAKDIIKTMIKKTCEANLVLSESSLLVGCPSKLQLFFVYVTLHDCMKTFQATFRHDGMLATNMWRKAISMYSSDYACCLAKKHFPISSTEPPGHLKDSICFCQYVATQLKMRDN